MPARLTRAAEHDLEVISASTIQRFGLAQARRTTLTLRHAIEKLAETPGLGHSRPDLSPPDRNFLYWTVLSRFLVVYVARDPGIVVVRVLHGARNLEADLADADDE